MNASDLSTAAVDALMPTNRLRDVGNAVMTRYWPGNHKPRQIVHDPAAAGATTWTVESLYEHFTILLNERDVRFDQRFHAQTLAISSSITEQRAAVDSALSAAQRAMDKAEAQMEHRFDAVNEFRAALTDQTARFIPRGEVEVMIERNSERISEMSVRVNGLASREDIMSAMKMMADRMEQLARQLTTIENRVTTIESTAAGQSRQRATVGATYGYVIAAITTIVAITSVIIALVIRY